MRGPFGALIYSAATCTWSSPRFAAAIDNVGGSTLAWLLRGNLIAAVGPMLAGVIFDLTGQWNFVLLLLAGMGALLLLCGSLAARAKRL